MAIMQSKNHDPVATPFLWKVPRKLIVIVNQHRSKQGLKFQFAKMIIEKFQSFKLFALQISLV